MNIEITGSTPPNKEVTAFVQQQMTDLAPFIDGRDPIELKISQPKKDSIYVEISALHPLGRIQTLAVSDNIYSAISRAKEGLLDCCIEMDSELNPQHRREQINQILHNENRALH